MRLGQTARLLKVTAADIVEALQADFREIKNHPNVKITDEELTFLKSNFGYVEEPEETVEAPLTEAPNEEPETEAKVEIEKAPAPVEEAEVAIETPSEPISDTTPKFVESLRPKVITLEKEFDEKKENLDTFKAEKPQLEGLKVLGKIDIPEPIKKEPKPEKENERPKRINTRNGKQNRKSNHKKHQDLTPAQERKKAERIALRKKQEEEKRQKELKKKHYQENVAAKIAKPKRKKKKKLVMQHEQTAPQAQNSNGHASQRPSNPIARFWKWLNGGYDSFN